MQNKSIMLAAAMSIATQLQVAAIAQSTENSAESFSFNQAEPIPGHIEKSDSARHLARPLQLLEQAKFAPPQPRRSPGLGATCKLDFALKTTKQGPGSLFSCKETERGLFETSTPEAEAAHKLEASDRLAPVELSLEELNGDRVIRWDDWYRQFVENFYVRFHRANNGDYPGECRILITVTKAGQLSVNTGNDFSKQSKNFQDTVTRAARLLSNSGTLEFPQDSQRDAVKFTMSVRSSQEKGTASFGWTQGDVERVPAR